MDDPNGETELCYITLLSSALVPKCLPVRVAGNKSKSICDFIYIQPSNKTYFFRMLEALKVKVLESVNATPEYRKLFIGLAEEGLEKKVL